MAIKVASRASTTQRLICAGSTLRFKLKFHPSLLLAAMKVVGICLALSANPTCMCVGSHIHNIILPQWPCLEQIFNWKCLRSGAISRCVLCGAAKGRTLKGVLLANWTLGFCKGLCTCPKCSSHVERVDNALQGVYRSRMLSLHFQEA
jgi:hypothetical protein